MGRPIVETDSLSKVYYRDKFKINALENINLKVDEGEFVALMGPSGSGKTTLLNLIGGIDKPTRGEIRVNGWNIGKMSESQLAKWRVPHVGFIFQLFNLIPVMTSYENVELPLLVLKMSRKERQRHTMAALEAVGLEDRAHHYPRQLSGGQEQRIAIARAIVTDPKLILADEPTGNLDAVSAEQILDLLGELNKRFNKTFIMVTHDPKAARRAGHTIHLEKGVIVNGYQ